MEHTSELASHHYPLRIFVLETYLIITAISRPRERGKKKKRETELAFAPGDLSQYRATWKAASTQQQCSCLIICPQSWSTFPIFRAVPPPLLAFAAMAIRSGRLDKLLNIITISKKYDSSSHMLRWNHKRISQHVDKSCWLVYIKSDIIVWNSLYTKWFKFMFRKKKVITQYKCYNIKYILLMNKKINIINIL